MSEDYFVIHLFATDECELVVDVPNIVMHDTSFFLVPTLNELGTGCSGNDSDIDMVFNCPYYDNEELENLVTRKKTTYN